MDVKRVVNECIKRLRQLPPVISVKRVKHSEKPHGLSYDFGLDLRTENGYVRFDVEVKGVLKRPMPTHLALSREESERHFLVMSEYVNPAIAEDLKKNQINFIDSVGNAFFHIPEKIYIEISGKKLEFLGDKKTSALIQPKGLQLLFLFLADEGTLSDTYRILSEKAGVSLDRVFTVRNELVHKGYVYTKDKKHYHFIDKKGLLERWLTNYVDRLRPKLVLGSFKVAPSVEEVISKSLQNTLANEQESFAIGGGLGADILLHYYRGPTTEIFIRSDLFEKVKTALKLIPAKDTNVTLLNLFSPRIIFQEGIQYPVAHPLLIYAELLYQGGSRALETAEMIYNTYLKQRFDEA